MDFSINKCSSDNVISKSKITKRLYLEYEPPPLTQQLIKDSSLKDLWISRNEDIISDLKWFIKLDYHAFWSYIFYDPNAMNSVTSFLQEAHPVYLMYEFPQDNDIWKSYQTIEYLVFLFIIRLSSYQDSSENNLLKDEYAKQIYENYIISIPFLFDLCVHYGEKYNNEVSNIINTIFSVQPLYCEDLMESINFTITTLRNVEHDLDVKPVVTNGELNKLSENFVKDKVTPKVFKDLILHSIDTVLSIKMFLTFYKPACKIFHQNSFELTLVNFYENVIPEMFKKLELFYNKEHLETQYKNLKSLLNFLRLEILKTFNMIIDSCINLLIEENETLPESEVKTFADGYLGIISEAISEKLFIHDYHNIYPVDVHLDTLHYLNKDLDRVKYDFILESIQTAFEVPPIPEQVNFNSQYIKKEISSKIKTNQPKLKNKVSGIELHSLISQVKDILNHLGDGFIEKCLEYFDYSTETVINTILENKLPDTLKSLDPNMPLNTLEEEHPLPERLNIYDNDEFDFMTQDVINLDKIILGKKQDQHKNIKELIDDKSFTTEYRHKFHNLGFVEEEDNLYDDEYDDTYDAANISVEEAGESERRPFVMPRVLQNPVMKEESEESEEEPIPSRSITNDFVQNPEEIRAKQENRRLQKFPNSQPNRTRDVVGTSKGQGQSKEVIKNRNQKTVNKSSRANHNRKYGAQKKRNQGMIS